MEKVKHIFGRFELELKIYPADKKLLCCTIQNPFVSYKHEITLLADNKEKLIRKVDRKIKELRKRVFQGGLNACKINGCIKQKGKLQ